jgi:signal peptidase I
MGSRGRSRGGGSHGAGRRAASTPPGRSGDRSPAPGRRHARPEPPAGTPETGIPETGAPEAPGPGGWQDHGPHGHDPYGHDPQGHDPHGHDPYGHDPYGHDPHGGGPEGRGPQAGPWDAPGPGPHGWDARAHGWEGHGPAAPGPEGRGWEGQHRAADGQDGRGREGQDGDAGARDARGREGHGRDADGREAGDRETGDGDSGDGDTGGPAEERPWRLSRAQRRKVAKRARNRRRLRVTREVPILVVAALLIALLLKTFLVQAFSIPSGSMENTIRVGDRVVVDKLTPWFGAEPHRGDVVVFEDPGGWLKGQPPPRQDPPVVKQVKEFFTFIGLLPSANEQDLIKRVVAVGGDTVECCDKDGRITVNGYPLHEPYLHPGNAPSMIRFKVQVPRGRMFVMGDHRANSADSRYHLDDGHNGTVPLHLVVGRAFAIAWPAGHWRRLQEPQTYASVPDHEETTPVLGAAAGRAGAGGAAGSPGPGAAGRELFSPGRGGSPVPAELPLVMTVVGLLPGRGRVPSGRRGLLGARDKEHGREE